jgi:ring-1,2-phenylacetyl-CoA epoxidase subunit PaaD
MREISVDIARRLSAAGYDEVSIRTQLAPAWSSDWITADGRRKLTSAGIAPPPTAPAVPAPGPIALTLSPSAPPATCPRCGSAATRRTAAFGATACKSLYRCEACDEPFEAVKPL